MIHISHDCAEHAVQAHSASIPGLIRSYKKNDSKMMPVAGASGFLLRHKDNVGEVSRWVVKRKKTHEIEMPGDFGFCFELGNFLVVSKRAWR